MGHNEEFAKKIKYLRTNKLMLTQVEFAKILGVSYESINRYERCKSVPTLKTRRKLVKMMKENGIEVE